jgi:DNA-binding protein HU-beta
MNKAELIEAIQETLGGTKADSVAALDAVIGAIVAGVKKDESVQIIGFGTFKISKRAARVGRNPQTGEKIQIGASKSVKFSPSASLKGSL